MNLTIALTLLAPAALAAIAFAGKRLRAAAVANDRGIALQTVIIMVVLLAIAGSVGAVLISTGGESVDDLEAAGPFSTNVTAANCASIKMGSVNGVLETTGSTTVTGSTKNDCAFGDASIGKGTCEIYSSFKGKGVHVTGKAKNGCILLLN